MEILYCNFHVNYSSGYQRRTWGFSSRSHAGPHIGRVNLPGTGYFRSRKGETGKNDRRGGQTSFCGSWARYWEVLGTKTTSTPFTEGTETRTRVGGRTADPKESLVTEKERTGSW